MKIMVFNVPAESGGALTILQDFYHEAAEYHGEDIEWIFVVSKPNLQEMGNVKVLRYPWVKKSWGYRLFFDNVVAPRLVRKYKVDKVFSLQNMVIPRINCNQTLYVHQPLPFVEYKFTFKENKLFWVYQNIIGKGIIHSIKKADEVIVQTKWMKDACVKKAKVSDMKITIIPPKIKIAELNYFEPNTETLSTFFYPASEMSYKNHSVIVEACQELSRITTKKFTIIFTLSGNETEDISNLYRIVKELNLPIKFVGKLTRKEVYTMYTQSVMLFPSYIETFGLPLLEARLHKSIVIASKSLFASEILQDYENAHFFNAKDYKELASIIKNILENNIIYEQEIIEIKQTHKNLVGSLL